MTDFSYQLYSSRNFGPMSKTLRMLADLGYVAAEGYGALYDDDDKIDALKAALDDTGLALRSSHVGLDLLEGDVDRALRIAEKLGLREVYGPHIGPDERPTDKAGWVAFGDRLAEAARPYLAEGMIFGWHNHDFEFAALPDGTLPIDAMLGADESLSFEFDVAWAVVANVDPQDSIAKYGKRVTAAHVKDRAAPGKTDEDGWADVGDGVIDWGNLITQLKANGTPNLIMEHDNPSDDVRFATASIAHAKSL